MQEAITDYWSKGYNFVKSKAKLFKLGNEPYILHIKLDTIRAKTGTIKDYKISDMKFYTETEMNTPKIMNNWKQK